MRSATPSSPSPGAPSGAATCATAARSAEAIASNFDAYADQLASIVTNVSRLYDTTLALPTFAPDDETIRLLHISDLHLNPGAWELIDAVAEQYDVDAIVDMRRHLTLEKGATPNKGAEVLDNLIATDNPGGFNPGGRMNWAADLNLQLFGDKKNADVLFWVGDGAFDMRNQRTLRPMR